MIDNLGGSSELGLGGNGVAVAYVFGLRVLLSGLIDEDTAGWSVRDGLKEANVERVAPPVSSTMFSVTAVDSNSRRLAVVQYLSSRID